MKRITDAERGYNSCSNRFVLLWAGRSCRLNREPGFHRGLNLERNRIKIFSAVQVNVLINKGWYGSQFIYQLFSITWRHTLGEFRMQWKNPKYTATQLYSHDLDEGKDRIDVKNWILRTHTHTHTHKHTPQNIGFLPELYATCGPPIERWTITIQRVVKTKTRGTLFKFSLFGYWYRTTHCGAANPSPQSAMPRPHLCLLPVAGKGPWTPHDLSLSVGRFVNFFFFFFFKGSIHFWYRSESK